MPAELTPIPSPLESQLRVQEALKDVPFVVARHERDLDSADYQSLPFLQNDDGSSHVPDGHIGVSAYFVIPPEIAEIDGTRIGPAHIKELIVKTIQEKPQPEGVQLLGDTIVNTNIKGTSFGFETEEGPVIYFEITINQARLLSTVLYYMAPFVTPGKLIVVIDRLSP